MNCLRSHAWYEAELGLKPQSTPESVVLTRAPCSEVPQLTYFTLFPPSHCLSGLWQGRNGVSSLQGI